VQSVTCGLPGQAQAGGVLPGGARVALQPQPRVVGLADRAAHAVHPLPPLDGRRLRLLAAFERMLLACCSDRQMLCQCEVEARNFYTVRLHLSCMMNKVVN
jgi:hypothetical protein